MSDNNFFIKLYRGDIPLVITFWVLYVVLGVIFQWLAGLLLPAAIAAVTILISYIYLIIALWNSAAKYEGPGIWKTLAYVAVAFSLFALIVPFFVLTGSIAV